MLPLPLPLHGKRLYQVFHRQVRRVIPVQDSLHKGRRQVGQAQDAAHKRWVDVLGFGDVRDRGMRAVEQLAVPAVADCIACRFLRLRFWAGLEKPAYGLGLM